LYLTCEKNFAEGIKIYEAIVKQKLLETTQSQIVSMDKLADKLNTVTEKVPEAAETKVLIEIKEKKESEKEKENEKVITDEEKKTLEKVDEMKMTDELIKEQTKEQTKEQPNVTPAQPVVAM